MNETLKLSLEFIILTISSIAYMVAVIALISRKNKTGLIKSYIAVILICLYWSIGEILVILFYHYDIEHLNIIITAKYLVSYFLCPSWLIFSLYYTGSRFIEDGLSIKKGLIIILPNLPSVLLSILNPNGFFSYMVDGLVHYSYGFWIYMSVQLCYAVLGALLMLKYALKNPSFIKKRTIMISTGYILSMLITVFYYAFNIHFKMSNMDVVPSAFVVSLTFQAIATFKYRFLNIFPMALSSIVGNMNEGILIVDSEGKIVFFNKALSTFFNGFEKLYAGMDAGEVSDFISTNGKYGDDGKEVVEAIGKGSFTNLSGEVKLYYSLQLQLNYQPLFKNHELIGWVVSFIDVGEYKAMLNELHEKNRKLSDANTRLLEHAKVVEELAAVRERDRVASEIHDSLGHSLSILVALLEVGKLGFSNDIKMSEEKVNSAYEVAKNSLKELRMTVLNLASSKMDGYNLLDAIESLKKGFEAIGIKVEYTVNGDIPETLDDETGKVIYGICQETLTNSLKHGEATNVNIILRFRKKLAEVFIFDNGKGCAHIVRGMGLKSMESRVNELNGKIFFGSNGEKGFNIHVEIPFK